MHRLHEIILSLVLLSSFLRHKTWLAMVMSGDNQGPQTADQVAGWITQIRSKFPNAKITMGGMDDFAESFPAEDPELPVVRGTISDNWIHGPTSLPEAATELMNIRPKLRAMEALRTHNILWGIEFIHAPEIIADAYANSLRWSEHTWGLANQHFVPSQVWRGFLRELCRRAYPQLPAHGSIVEGPRPVRTAYPG